MIRFNCVAKVYGSPAGLPDMKVIDRAGQAVLPDQHCLIKGGQAGTGTGIVLQVGWLAGWLVRMLAISAKR